MKPRTFPVFMFLALVMGVAPGCLAARASQKTSAKSSQPSAQPRNKTAPATKGAASATSKALLSTQSITSSAIPTILEAATKQFNSEAHAIEQNSEKLAAMQKELNEEAEQSAGELPNGPNSTVGNEPASSQGDLWGGLGVSLGEPDQSGIPVQNVRPDSPAARAGLRTGDVITELDGTTVHSPADLRAPLADSSPKQIHLQARRHGIELSLSIPTNMTQPARPAQTNADLPLSR